ncbi:MAG: hypothetical protein ABH890_03980 [Bacillota bacterium]
MQYHGHVVYAKENEKIAIKQDDGTHYSIPPVLENIFIAEPGFYQAKSTGKIVVDPDYISNWVIEVKQ